MYANNEKQIYTKTNKHTKNIRYMFWSTIAECTLIVRIDNKIKTGGIVTECWYSVSTFITSAVNGRPYESVLASWRHLEAETVSHIINSVCWVSSSDRMWSVIYLAAKKINQIIQNSWKWAPARPTRGNSNCDRNAGVSIEQAKHCKRQDSNLQSPRWWSHLQI